MDLNILLNTTSDGVAVTDAEGNFIFFNQAHCSLFGYETGTELLGASWRILYPEDEIKRLEETAIPALMESGNWQGLMQAKRRDGSFFNERLSLSMLADGGILCLCNELTDVQWSQSKIGQIWQKRSEEMEQRGRMFSLANHEMRAPLASILLAAEMLNLPAAAQDAERRGKLIKEIRSQALRAGGLMDKFLFLGRQFSGLLPFSPLETDLRVFIHGLSIEDWGLPKDVSHAVRFHLRGEFLVRVFDPVLFRHSLENLISNAAKYRRAGTVVCLDIDASGEEKILFSVSNQGPVPELGIAEHVFEPFFRHDYTGFEMVQGSGLGLYLVRECVRTHGGEVRMEPLADGVRIAGCLHAPCVTHKPQPVFAIDE
jgi:PAS domain S-box-containing protein